MSQCLILSYRAALSVCVWQWGSAEKKTHWTLAPPHVSFIEGWTWSPPAVLPLFFCTRGLPCYLKRLLVWFPTGPRLGFFPDPGEAGVRHQRGAKMRPILWFVTWRSCRIPPAQSCFLLQMCRQTKDGSLSRHLWEKLDIFSPSLDIKQVQLTVTLCNGSNLSHVEQFDMTEHNAAVLEPPSHPPTFVNDFICAWMSGVCLCLYHIRL